MLRHTPMALTFEAKYKILGALWEKAISLMCPPGRSETFARFGRATPVKATCVAVAVGVAVGSGVGDGVTVGTAVGVEVGVGVLVGSGVAVGNGVCVAVGFGVAVLVAVGVAEGAGVDVAVGGGVEVPDGSTLGCWASDVVASATSGVGACSGSTHPMAVNIDIASTVQKTSPFPT